MLNYFIFIFVFLITLFFYIHIIYHHKISNDLEIYDIKSIHNVNLDDLLDLRQPVSIQDEKFKPLDDIDIDELTNFFGAFDLKLWKTDTPKYMTKNEPNIILIQDIIHFFQNNHSLISSQNEDFLKDSSLYQKLSNVLSILKPKICSNTNIDICVLSKHAFTPLQYKISYRHYILATQGEMKVKLIPPKYTKYLHMEYDYLNFLFESPIHPWDVQEEYSMEFNKIMSLDITLQKNDILYIPSYWWYSFQSNSNISMFIELQYGTYMNHLANIYHHGIHFLQKQNIKYDFLPKKQMLDTITIENV